MQPNDLSVTQVAAMCGVTRQAILHRIARNGLPARMERVGLAREWRIDRAELAAWAVENEIDLREVKTDG